MKSLATKDAGFIPYYFPLFQLFACKEAWIIFFYATKIIKKNEFEFVYKWSSPTTHNALGVIAVIPLVSRYRTKFRGQMNRKRFIPI